jgi:uncharacterized protein (DUF427 family)
MKAIWNDIVIAESDATIVLEGNHYFPFDSINQAYFIESTHTSTCGWKGYKAPKEAAKEIKGYIAFWKGITVTE